MNKFLAASAIISTTALVESPASKPGACFGRSKCAIETRGNNKLIGNVTRDLAILRSRLDRAQRNHQPIADSDKK